jgi:hypothetical protein
MPFSPLPSGLVCWGSLLAPLGSLMVPFTEVDVSELVLELESTFSSPF